MNINSRQLTGGKQKKYHHRAVDLREMVLKPGCHSLLVHAAPRASMSLLMSVIMRSHSSPSEASWPSSEAALSPLPPAAPLPLVVESEAELAVRR
ncbi:hypothetical protein INR49_017677 [Caranx melampygus]|nr:hypothetical protein INR49_017677 [Caranx melampygus]